MRCRTRNARALRCKPDGWLPSWDSLTRLLQTLIVPEWPQSEQPADVSLQSIGFAGRQSDASRWERQREEGRQPSPRRHGEHGEDPLAKSQKQNDHGATRISRISQIKESTE